MNEAYEVLMSIFDCTCILFKFSKKKYSRKWHVLNERRERVLENFSIRKELHRKYGLSGYDFTV